MRIEYQIVTDLEQKRKRERISKLKKKMHLIFTSNNNIIRSELKAGIEKEKTSWKKIAPQKPMIT